jgi:hypothetical protein
MPTAPARPIVDTFPQVSLSVIRRAYPYLQDRVHRALVDLTPHRLVTIFRAARTSPPCLRTTRFRWSGRCSAN